MMLAGLHLSILGVKAESAGQLVIGFDPRNTTQNCSGCGVKVLKHCLIGCMFKCGVTLERSQRCNKYKEIGGRAFRHWEGQIKRLL